MDTDHEVNRTRHQMKVPGLGVLIARKAIGRLFTLHDYTKCSRFGKQPMPPETVSDFTTECVSLPADVSSTKSGAVEKERSKCLSRVV